MHTLPRYGLIFSFQMPYFLHWLFSSTLLTQLKPPEASEQAAKKVEGAALKLPPGLMRPGPCEPVFWKNDPPANLFLLCIIPKSVINLHRLFNMPYINTHFDIFFKIKAWLGVIYFLVCVRRYESNLPTNIYHDSGEENTIIQKKMRPFE